MSSNILVVRICQYCGKEFLARTTVTKNCSPQCAKRAYKARIRTQKIERSDAETQHIISQPIKDIQAREFLNVKDVAQLIGIGTRTVFRLIEQGQLPKIKVGKRTVIKRSDVDRLMNP